MSVNPYSYLNMASSGGSHKLQMHSTKILKFRLIIAFILENIVTLICQHLKSYRSITESWLVGQKLDHSHAGHVGVPPVLQDGEPHLPNLLPVVNFEYLPVRNIKR